MQVSQWQINIANITEIMIKLGYVIDYIKEGQSHGNCISFYNPAIDISIQFVYITNKLIMSYTSIVPREIVSQILQLVKPYVGVLN